MEILSQDLVAALQRQRNAALDDAAMLSAQVKELERRLKNTDDEITKAALKVPDDSPAR